jgi:dolichol-phosphate mannosyltransferase
VQLKTACLIAALLGLLLLGQTFYNYIKGGAVVGFTTVIALQILIGGLLMVVIGILSIYVSKIYEEQKQRPIFITQSKSGSPTSREI